jgi:hypothetical protein
MMLPSARSLPTGGWVAQTSVCALPQGSFEHQHRLKSVPLEVATLLHSFPKRDFRKGR